MKISKLLIALSLLSVTVACGHSDMDPEQTPCSSVIVSTIEMINGDSDTRVAVDLSSGSPEFPFTVTDTLGIFPSVGDQVSFPLSGSAGSTTAFFDGGGWALKKGYSYYAYMPFSRVNFASYEQKNKLPISFTGQWQDNVNNTAGIGSFVFMSSEATTQDSGSLIFQLRHIGALARIGVTFPEAVKYKKIYLLAEKDVFPTSGTINLESNSIDIKPEEYSDRIGLSLKNVLISSSQLSTSYNFYMMFPPCDCSDQTLKIVLVDEFGYTYKAATRIGKTNNFEAGYYYGFTTTESFVKSAYPEELKASDVSTPDFNDQNW